MTSRKAMDLASPGKTLRLRENAAAGETDMTWRVFGVGHMEEPYYLTRD